MQQWFEFYAVIGAAAAALQGLLFVAISMNAAAALGVGRESSRRMAEQAFQNYLAVLMVSLVALFPDLEIRTFGFVSLCVTAVWTLWMLIRLYLAATGPVEHGARFFTIRRHMSSFVGFALLIISAFRMAVGYGVDRHLFAVGAIVLLFSATTVSWQLLIGIAKTSVSQRAEAP